MFQSVLEAANARYVLSYEPAGVARHGRHRLKVWVKRRGVEVRARKEYVVPATRPRAAHCARTLSPSRGFGPYSTEKVMSSTGTNCSIRESSTYVALLLFEKRLTALNTPGAVTPQGWNGVKMLPFSPTA